MADYLTAPELIPDIDASGCLTFEPESDSNVDSMGSDSDVHLADTNSNFGMADLDLDSGMASPLTRIDTSSNASEKFMAPSSIVRNNIGQEFHPFPFLPGELRLKIWSYLLPESRVVEIEWGKFEGPYCWTAPLRSTPRPCVLLSISQEPRAHFLSKYYQLNIWHYEKKWMSAFIDPKIDTLYLREKRNTSESFSRQGFWGRTTGLEKEPLARLCPGFLEKVRTVALEWQPGFCEGPYQWSHFKSVVKNFKGLETILATLDDIEDGCCPWGFFYVPPGEVTLCPGGGELRFVDEADGNQLRNQVTQSGIWPEHDNELTLALRAVKRGGVLMEGGFVESVSEADRSDDIWQYIFEWHERRA